MVCPQALLGQLKAASSSSRISLVPWCQEGSTTSAGSTLETIRIFLQKRYVQCVVEALLRNCLQPVARQVEDAHLRVDLIRNPM